MSEEVQEYQTTKEECQGKIKGVCSGCGGEITPMETVDNAGRPTFWPGCSKCEVIDYGVSPHVFEIAKKMVTEHHYRPVPMDDPNSKSRENDQLYKQYWLNSQIRHMSSTVSLALKLHNELNTKH